MRVYIAGPYSIGDTVAHVRGAVEAAEEVFEAGHTPFVPHLFHLWHLIRPRPYEDWMALDFEWLKVCEAVIRIPGASTGADREEEWALKNGTPVFYSVGEFLETLG